MGGRGVLEGRGRGVGAALLGLWHAQPPPLLTPAPPHTTPPPYWHPLCSNALEDPWVEPSESMFTRSVSPEQAPDAPTYVDIDFEKGDPVALDGVRMSPATLLTALNKLGGDNGGGVGGGPSMLDWRSAV